MLDKVKLKHLEAYLNNLSLDVFMMQRYDESDVELTLAEWSDDLAECTRIVKELQESLSNAT